MNTKDPLFSPEIGSYHTNNVPIYEGHEEIPGESPSAQKFTIPSSLANELKTLADLEGTSKSEIVRKALYQYFYLSHVWNNTRRFLKPKVGVVKPVTYEDLKKEGSNSRVSVMWVNSDKEPREKSHFLCCRIVDLRETTVVINPSFYLVPSSEESSPEKSEVIKPEFYEFDPNTTNSFPYLYNLMYEIEHQYIWSILPN